MVVHLEGLITAVKAGSSPRSAVEQQLDLLPLLNSVRLQ